MLPMRNGSTALAGLAPRTMSINTARHATDRMDASDDELAITDRYLTIGDVHNRLPVRTTLLPVEDRKDRYERQEATTLTGIACLLAASLVSAHPGHSRSRRLARCNLKIGQKHSLRQIAAELAALGHLSPSARLYHPGSIRHRLEGCRR